MSLLLDAIRRTDPWRMALADDRRELRYGALAAALEEESGWLAARGAARFGLLAENGVAWALADLALHESGKLNVPLPGWFGARQLGHAVEDAGIEAVLTDRPRELLEQWPQLTFAARAPRSGLTLLERRAGSTALPALPAGGVAKVTYTSGSTAEPKGVCLTAATLERVVRSLAGVTAPLRIARHLCLMPLPTLLENLAGLYVPLLTGASCIVPSAATTGMSYGGVEAPRLLAAVSAAGPESLILVPELLRLLLAATDAGWRPPESLKFIAVGGAPVSRELLERAASLGLPVFQGYGLSECASVVCLNTPGANRSGSVGRVLPHARVRLDGQGQLRVSGATMAGYLGAPPRGPACAGPAEVATGDLGEIDAEGYVYLRGRLGSVFITSLGRNLSPEWIERELACEPQIRCALACGEGLPFAVALLQPAGPAVDDTALAAAVARANARLPEHARVRRWARLPEAPSLANGLLTANGRLRREALLARHAPLVAALGGSRDVAADRQVALSA